MPRVVVIAETVEDVATVLWHARDDGRHVVFRAAGTSLNGQAQGDDILVDVRRDWTGLRMLDDGVRARIRPGTTVGRANITPPRHGRLMDPGLASSSACTVGGVVADKRLRHDRTPDEFDDPDDLELTCSVNGEQVQRRPARQLIFPVLVLVSKLSAVLEVWPGDVIYTGPSAGVDLGRTP
ncbi:FAD-binding protein [Streptomyces sp. CL12-4]|nr:FAD-binding protein [Streptomyces sp. CL12-4]